MKIEKIHKMLDKNGLNISSYLRIIKNIKQTDSFWFNCMITENGNDRLTHIIT